MPKAARPTAKSHAVLTRQVVEKLRKAGADDSDASELADAVAGLAGPGWTVRQVETRGRFEPDGIWVHMTGERAQLSDLVGRLEGTSKLEELRVLINGVLPEVQLVEARVGFGT